MASGPLDPRLLRWASATRRYLGWAVVVGGATAALVIVQAWLLADVLAAVITHQRSLGQLRWPVIALLVVIVGRALLGWLAERSAQRASAAAKSQLRLALAGHIAALGPAAIDRQPPAALASLAATGIDQLDAYFARYLPQLVLAVLVPVAAVVVIGTADWVSAVIVALTVPLIPIFMGLIGAATRQQTERKMRALHRLAGHFLDVVAGLPTLKVFGRAKAQVDSIRRITDQYRAATLGTLKVAFLSSLVLELLATVSVALVAVAVGLRLLGGQLDLRTGLLVLVLAPEAYLPLRSLATNFHASADGLKAAERIFEVLESPAVPPGSPQPAGTVAANGARRVPPDPSAPPVVLDGLSVTYPGRSHPALAPVSLEVGPGQVVVLAGPSGCGKSTLLGVLVGLVTPTQGSALLGGVELSRLDVEAWRRQLAWVPQRPHLFADTIAANVRLGRPGASHEQVTVACEAAGLGPVLRRLPGGLSTTLGEGGAGLSVGERRRVALARAFVRQAPLLLLDEPTAGLDGATEQEVLAAVARLLEGRTALVASHRPALLERAERIVDLASVGAPP